MVDVIGAGFGRTGTASLKRALESLGFGPCHHMSEVLKRPATAAGWARALGGDVAVLTELLDGYGAALDLPSCLLWRELSELWPHARVVLTVRDPAAWYRSARATILSQDKGERVERLAAAGGSGLVEALAPLSAAMAARGFRRDLGEAETIAEFLRHNDSVRAGVPAERLLVYEVEQGWAPLCAFLGVEVPDVPFPRGNDAGSFQRNVDQAVRTGADFD
jgi:sulfotransferase family protein